MAEQQEQIAHLMEIAGLTEAAVVARATAAALRRLAVLERCEHCGEPVTPRCTGWCDRDD